MGDPGRAHHRLPRPGGPSPGQEGAAWCGRPHPPHPRTARRRDEHPDLGPGERNGPPPAPGAPPPGPGVFLRPPPQPLGKAQRTRTPTATEGRYLPKGTPITSHQPLPGRHRRRTGQLPPRHPRLPHPTRSIHPTHCHHPLTPPFSHRSRDSAPDAASMPRSLTLAPGGSDSKSARMAEATLAVLASTAAETSLISSME